MAQIAKQADEGKAGTVSIAKVKPITDLEINNNNSSSPEEGAIIDQEQDRISSQEPPAEPSSPVEQDLQDDII